MTPVVHAWAHALVLSVPRLACVLSLCACAPVSPTATPAPVTATRPAPPSPPPEPATTCKYTDEPPARFSDIIPATDGPCHPLPAAVKTNLHTQINERWKYRIPKGRLEIGDGCDHLDPQIDLITFEGSGGHGGSLLLAGFERRPDAQYDLVLLEYNHYSRGPITGTGDPYKEDSAGALAAYHATLPATTMSPLLARLRAAVHVDVIEHEPPPSPGKIRGGGSYSSGTYHAGLRLTGHDGRGVQRLFIGHRGTGPRQGDGVPLAIVQATIAELLADPSLRASFTPVGNDDPAARLLFARMFWQAHARGPDDGSWYVHERLLGIAALLGSDQHIPALLTDMRAPGDASIARSRILAVNAVAAITGHDLRYHDGAPRNVDDVLAETLAACTH